MTTEIETLHAVFAKGFMVAKSGDGDPCIEISFRTLADMHAAHSALISALLPPASTGTGGEQIEAAKAEGMDWAADFILSYLATTLNLETFEPKDGTETWDGDVSATVHGILIDAGVIDDETGAVAKHATPSPPGCPIPGAGVDADLPAPSKRVRVVVFDDWSCGAYPDTDPRFTDDWLSRYEPGCVVDAIFALGDKPDTARALAADAQKSSAPAPGRVSDDPREVTDPLGFYLDRMGG